jgi:hypothetical protein
MKVSVEVVPKQTVFNEIAGRPVVDKLVVPVAPDLVPEYLRKKKTIIVLYIRNTSKQRVDGGKFALR